MTTEPPTLYTTKDAAEQLGISRQLAHRYARQLGLGVLVGGHRLLTARDIDAIRQRPDHRAIGLTHRWPAPGHDERP